MYHPSKNGNGFAASFWLGRDNDCIFATILKQSGWDEKNQTGTFKDSVNDPNKKVNIKLNYVEIASILDCVERNRPFKTFHDHNEFPKSISFIPWMTGEENAKQQKGYSFTITITSKQDTSFKNAFYIGFTFSEARLIREYLIFALHVCFNQSVKNKISNINI